MKLFLTYETQDGARIETTMEYNPQFAEMCPRHRLRCVQATWKEMKSIDTNKRRWISYAYEVPAKSPSVPNPKLKK